MKIWAIDPGINNFAFSLVSDKPDVLFIGHLKNTIQSIKKDDIEAQICSYKWEIEEIIPKLNLNKKDKIVIERYQPRGTKNLQIELINIMIGIIADKFEHQLLLLTPSTWKNYIKKIYSTNNMTEIIKNKNISPHIKDSIGIASYVFERHYNKSILETLSNETWITTCQK